MKKIFATLLCLCSLSYAVDYDPVKAEMLSLSCNSCHGTDGKSVAIMPSIAGMGKSTMYSILLSYKNGEKVGTNDAKTCKRFY